MNDLTLDTPPLRLDDAIEWFLSSWPHEGPRVPTADTVRTYGIHLRWFRSFALERGKITAASARTPEFVRLALAAQMAPRAGRAGSFKGGEAAAGGVAHATRKLARWLIAQSVTVDDLNTVKPPRPPERIQRRLQPEEFQALETAVLHRLLGRSSQPICQAIVARDLALLYLLADTGLRCGEVCSMTVHDVDFVRGRISVWRGKGRKQRVLSIVDADDPRGGPTLQLLTDWVRLRETIRGTSEHDLLWTSGRGRGLTRAQLRLVLGGLCKAAGLDASRPPHAFRRAVFTEAYRDNPAALEVLAARMGWSEKSHHMVSVYTRGAKLELAATETMPSLASRWHSGVTPRVGYLQPPVSKLWRQAAEAQEVAPRPKPAPVQRQENLHALLAFIRDDPALRRALVQALS